MCSHVASCSYRVQGPVRRSLNAGSGAAGGVDLQHAVGALHVERRRRRQLAPTAFHAATRWNRRHYGITARVVARGPSPDIDHGLLDHPGANTVGHMGYLAQTMRARSAC